MFASFLNDLQSNLSTNSVIAILAIVVAVDTLLLILTLVVTVATRRSAPSRQAPGGAGAVPLATAADLEARLTGRSTAALEQATGSAAELVRRAGPEAMPPARDAADLAGQPSAPSAARRAVEDVLAQVDRMAAPEAFGPIVGAETGVAGAGPAPQQPTPQPDGQDLLVDRSTGVGSGLAWEHALVNEGHRFTRYGRPVTVAIAELAGIERLEEQFGEPASDRVVRAVADTLLRSGRASDVVARIGPARFGILLPETDEIAAINYVERVRAACDRWLEVSAVSLRLAVGWASPSPNGSLAGAAQLAFERLYAEERPRAAVPARRRTRSPQPAG